MKIVFLFFVLSFSLCSRANAQMAVIDAQGFAEATKTNATLAAIADTAKEAYQQGKEALNTAQEINNSIGEAVSLALTAQSFIKQSGELMQCIVPNFNIPNSTFEITSICSAQDYIRKALDLPTSTDIQNASDSVSGNFGGAHSWRNLGITKEKWREVKKARQTFHKATVDDALATAVAMRASSQSAVAGAMQIVQDTNSGTTVMEKLSNTNKALADIHAVLVQQNVILANLLQVVASREKMNESTIIQDSALEEETKK